MEEIAGTDALKYVTWPSPWPPLAHTGKAALGAKCVGGCMRAELTG